MAAVPVKPWLTDADVTLYHGDVLTVLRECPCGCGETFAPTGSRVPKPWLRGKRNGMSGRTGASNPNWKGGTTPERQALYASSEWRRVCREVKHRDGGCAECGSAADLHVHHIRSFAEFPALRLDPANLQTLCRPCHHAKHRKGGEANQ